MDWAWNIAVKFVPTMSIWEGDSSFSSPRCITECTGNRKNFDRHFQESRHAFGMRALGLPNTKHFHEITRIEDALARE